MGVRQNRTLDRAKVSKMLVQVEMSMISEPKC